MKLKIDLHIHTTFSKCGDFTIDELADEIERRGLEWMTVTDHGSAQACEELQRLFPRLKVVHGIEIAAQEGHFLIFTADREFALGLSLYAKSAADLPHREDTAVIWAHPRGTAPGGWTTPNPDNPQTRRVMETVDGIEVFNSRMLKDRHLAIPAHEYVAGLEKLAQSFGKSRTGGSDSHTREGFMTSWTEFDPAPAGIEEFVGMLKSCAVCPGTSVKPFGEAASVEAKQEAGR